MSSYGRRYRAARALAGMTQDDLAAALGVEVQTVRRTEQGKRNPKRMERIAVAAVTGVPLSFIEGTSHGAPTDEPSLNGEPETTKGPPPPPKRG